MPGVREVGECTLGSPNEHASLTAMVAVQVVVDPASNRLQLLAPFSKWNGGDIEGAQVRALHHTVGLVVAVVGLQIH